MDGTVREPRYYRLKQHLLALTASAAPGSPIPPERSLAAEFGTSRTTVRQALQELVVEGRLERRQGKGTFVAHPKLAQPLTLTSYTEDMRAQGIVPSSRLLDLSTIRADRAMAPRLDVGVGDRVTRIERLRLANEVPMAVERSHLAADRFPRLKRHLVRLGSLYDALREEYGVEPGRAEQTIETAALSPQDAALLGADTGLPVLLLSRHTFDTHGRPFEWVRAVYRGDRYKLVATLSRP